MEQITVCAWWQGDSYHAVVHTSPSACEHWYSSDGDWWNDADGKAVESPAFVAARIEFRGGPRDGESVA